MTIMKKMFEQPTIEVVRLNNHDIVTLSFNETGVTGVKGDGADRFRDFEDYNY